jgi:hypothetical protein
MFSNMWASRTAWHPSSHRLSSIRELVDRGGAVTKKVPFVVTFAVGMIVGASSQHIPFLTVGAPDPWGDSEEAILGRMHGFQERLDQLENLRPDSVEALSKQTEAQRGIEDILTKYREAKNAKLAPYFTGGFAGAIIAAIGTWLVGRRKSKSTPDA